MVDRVLLRPPPGAEMQCRHADRDRAEPNDRAVPWRAHLLDDRRLRERGRIGIAALRPDPALVDGERGAVGDGRLGSPSPLVLVDPEIGEREQSCARVEDELREVRRPLAADGVARLGDLERVADGRPQRLVHVGEQADDLAPRVLAELEHRLGERPRVLERLHEGTVADLDVEHDRVGAAGDLLRHDRGCDQGQDVDGAGDVTKPVELLVGRDEVVGLADDREPDLLDLGDEVVDGEVDAEARNRLELVERAARVPEAAAAHLPDGHPAGRHDRADRDRRLVADASGRVLVHDLAAECRAEVERATAADHRIGERVRLCRRHPAEVDGHAERGQLIVRDLAPRVAEDQLRDLVGGKLLPVPLPLDQLGGMDHGCRIGVPGIPRPGALPPSHAFTVAPTSPNSPSCTAPRAFRPAAYASRSACSREWSVDGVVGSQP